MKSRSGKVTAVDKKDLLPVAWMCPNSTSPFRNKFPHPWQGIEYAEGKKNLERTLTGVESNGLICWLTFGKNLGSLCVASGGNFRRIIGRKLEYFLLPRLHLALHSTGTNFGLVVIKPNRDQPGIDALSIT